MEDNKKKIEDEAMEKISGAGEEVTIVDYFSPCPCGGNHDWERFTRMFPVGIFEYFVCKKCGGQTQDSMCG